MPASFVLVMSFTLKNTLIARIDLPKAGWVVEDNSPAAAQWTSDWLAQHGGQRFPSREALQAALKSRQVEAGVIVRAPWIGKDGRPHGDQLEMWLGNRVQPAAAARLRAELSFSMAASAGEDRGRRGGVIRKRPAGQRGQFRVAARTGLARDPLPVRNRVRPDHDRGPAKRAGMADLRHVLRRDSRCWSPDPGAQ